MNTEEEEQKIKFGINFIENLNENTLNFENEILENLVEPIIEKCLSITSSTKYIKWAQNYSGGTTTNDLVYFYDLFSFIQYNFKETGGDSYDYYSATDELSKGMATYALFKNYIKSIGFYKAKKALKAMYSLSFS